MKDLKWKTLSSKYLFKDSWLTARQDRCEMPDGRIVDPYYVMEYKDWANAVAFTKDNKILLVRQYRHALGDTCFELPGGCIEQDDDSPLSGLKRELLEETGYTFKNFTDLGTISANPSTNDNITYMFLAEGGEKIQDQDLDPNEEIEIYTYSVKEVLDIIDQHKMMQSLHVSSLYFALKKKGLLTYTP